MTKFCAFASLGAFLAASTPVSATSIPGPSGVLFSAPAYSCVKNYYVSTTGKDSNSGTSASSPWLTLQHANDVGRTAGDCVNVAAGTYKGGVLISYGGNASTSTGYVVYRCTTMDACIVTDVSAGGQNGSFVWKTVPVTNPPTTAPGSYIMIDGFKLQASTETLFGQGIELWDGTQESQWNATPSVHHVWILNSIITGYGQSGVQMNDGEYFFVVHNTIYANSHAGCAAQGSGISFAGLKAFSNYQRVAWDSNNPILGNIGSFNNAMEWNVLYNNATTTCGNSKAPYDTDGNNIILDTLDNAGSTNVVYPGSVLVAFNITYNAGGRGIHIFNSENVTVANNTCFNNALDPYDSGTYRPCIGDLNGYNDTFFNNLAYAITGSGYLAFNQAFVGAPITGKTPDTFKNNMSYCSGKPPPWGGCTPMYGADTFACTNNECNVNPGWVSVGGSSPGTEVAQPVAANFALTKGSPAIGKGLTASYLSSQSKDMGACASWLSVCPSTSAQPDRSGHYWAPAKHR